MIQIFPNRESVLRLMGAVAIEYSDEQKEKQRVFTAEKLREIENAVYVEFSKIAERQLKQMPAA